MSTDGSNGKGIIGSISSFRGKETIGSINSLHVGGGLKGDNAVNKEDR